MLGTGGVGGQVDIEVDDAIIPSLTQAVAQVIKQASLPPHLVSTIVVTGTLPNIRNRSMQNVS